MAIIGAIVSVLLSRMLLLAWSWLLSLLVLFYSVIVIVIVVDVLWLFGVLLSVGGYCYCYGVCYWACALLALLVFDW